MKLTPVFAVGLCAVLIGCSPKPPPAEAILAVASEAIKKERPEASVDSPSVNLDKYGKYVTVRFTCKDCPLIYGGEKIVSPSARGSAMATLDDGKWNLKDVVLETDEGAKNFIHVGHTF